MPREHKSTPAGLMAWLHSQPVEALVDAEASPQSTTPTHLLTVIRARPPFEREARLLVVDVLRLPGSEQWAAA